MAKLRLREAMHKYNEHMVARRLSPRTIHGHMVTLGQFADVTGDLILDNIRSEHVDRVFNQFNWAPTTRNTRIGQFKAFFAWAQGARYMNASSNPMIGYRQRKTPDVVRLRIPHSEWPRLFDACTHPQERIVIATGLYLFLRASEQEALKVSCVNLQTSHINVWRPKIRKWQTMPICTELDDEMRLWLTWLSTNYGTQPDNPLICAREPRGVLDPVTHKWTSNNRGMIPTKAIQYTHRTVQRVIERAGFPVEKGQGEHTLRRSGARALFDQLVSEGYDGSLKVVQTLLGHKNSAQTEHYLGIDIDQKRVLETYAGRPMFGAPNTNVVRMRRPEHG